MTSREAAMRGLLADAPSPAPKWLTPHLRRFRELCPELCAAPHPLGDTFRPPCQLPTGHTGPHQSREDT